MKAELCPVCGGSGQVGCPSPPEGPECETTCHGCEGKGWVTVSDNPTYTTTTSVPSGYVYNPCTDCQYYMKPMWVIPECHPCRGCWNNKSTVVTWTTTTATSSNTSGGSQ